MPRKKKIHKAQGSGSSGASDLRGKRSWGAWVDPKKRESKGIRVTGIKTKTKKDPEKKSYKGGE